MPVDPMTLELVPKVQLHSTHRHKRPRSRSTASPMSGARISDSPTKMAEMPAASKSFHISSSADSAFTDQHNLVWDSVAKPQCVLEVSTEIVKIAVVDPDEIGTRGKDTVEIGHVVKLDQGRHFQAFCPFQEAGQA